MPVGILHNNGGAEIGATANATLTYEDIVSLYFSLKSEYRENGIWLINDNTAKATASIRISLPSKRSYAR